MMADSKCPARYTEDDPETIVLRVDDIPEEFRTLPKLSQTAAGVAIWPPPERESGREGEGPPWRAGARLKWEEGFFTGTFHFATGVVFEKAVPYNGPGKMPMRDPDMPRDILTIREVADYPKLTERTLYRLVQEGKRPAFKVGNSWRLRREDLE